jgi:tol-pal system protein YbgF
MKFAWQSLHASRAAQSLRAPRATQSWRGARAAAFALIAALPMLAAGAPVALGQTVEDRLLQLEREMQNLERKVYRNDQAPSGYQVNSPQLAQNTNPGGYAVQDRMNGLEQQMNSLTGQIEELQNRVAQLTNRLDKLTTDLEFRVSQLEGGQGGRPPGQVAGGNFGTAPPGSVPPGNAPRNTVPPPGAGGNPTPLNDGVLRPPPPGQQGYQPSVAPPNPRDQQQATLPPTGGSPEQQYQAAFDLINAHDYPAAEAAMRAFVQRNPKHALASNAQFWLGETFYVRNDFQNAAVAYADGYKNYPKGNKAPDTLLKLGMALSAQKKDQDACAVYDRLTKEFPQAPDLVRRRVVEERKKSRCG